MGPYRLIDIALALVAQHARALEGPERAWLEALPAIDARAALQEVSTRTAADDAPLLGLRESLRLSDAEIVAVALAAAVESDPMIGRVIARLQHPVGGSRPMLGFLATLLSPLVPNTTVPGLAAGPACTTGLLEATMAPAPLPERAVAVPLHLLATLRGDKGRYEGCSLGDDEAHVPLPPSILEQARQQAAALAGVDRVLVLRSGHEAEARAAAGAIALALDKRPLFIEAAHVTGLVPWIYLARLIPVFVRRPGPGERARLPTLPGYAGPTLAVTGPDGGIEAANGAALTWRLPIPPRSERRLLWAVQLNDDAPLADTLSVHRHGSGRIADLGRLARHQSATSNRPPTEADVRAVAWLGDASGLGSLAQGIPAEIPDEALVVPDSVRAALELLLARCRAREDLVSGLGVAATQRYTPGVRALFVGPSGTGKTLAALWLATRLQMPLYRVDVASVSSKYIGETERNLADLLARAEHAEVVLLFDEADSLFGKRTEVRHSTDRFANAQTNYLLQRIETYEGITLLTSNSRSRFDDSFMRRLDLVIEVPIPGPEERRGLWAVHLGAGHDLDAKAINRLAAVVDLPGGNLRNAVLSAAVIAQGAGRRIRWKDIVRGLELEYRKVGRQLPAGLGTEEAQ